ncbi:hypothetical protein C8Q73DRAFT_37146 [Cubamyces lactineus]|nr:hypothetical protein C8Q73DRAFT_37146 [Cubamyces lactineus]
MLVTNKERERPRSDIVPRASPPYFVQSSRGSNIHDQPLPHPTHTHSVRVHSTVPPGTAGCANGIRPRRRRRWQQECGSGVRTTCLAALQQRTREKQKVGTKGPTEGSLARAHHCRRSRHRIARAYHHFGDVNVAADSTGDACSEMHADGGALRARPHERLGLAMVVFISCSSAPRKARRHEIFWGSRSAESQEHAAAAIGHCDGCALTGGHGKVRVEGEESEEAEMGGGSGEVERVRGSVAVQ